VVDVLGVTVPLVGVVVKADALCRRTIIAGMRTILGNWRLQSSMMETGSEN
jgi:hypothetical protein